MSAEQADSVILLLRLILCAVAFGVGVLVRGK